jgi:hypothetical protein
MTHQFCIWDMDRTNADNKGGLGSKYRGRNPQEALDSFLAEYPDAFGATRVLVASMGIPVERGPWGHVSTGGTHLGGWAIFNLAPPKGIEVTMVDGVKR